MRAHESERTGDTGAFQGWIWCAAIGAALIGTISGTAAQERGPLGTVTLSRSEYDRLLDLVSRRPPDPERAPLPAALTRADIRVRVAGTMARATIGVDGQVFHSGVLKVPLISGATLLDARMADRPLPVVADGDTLSAVIAGPSTFAATLEWAAPLTITPGRGAFVLPVPKAGSVTATIDVPGEMSDVRISPGLVLRRTSGAGRTIIDVTLDPGSPTQVWWSARETTPIAPPKEVRTLADVKTLVTIGDADVRLLGLVDLTVVQGEPATIAVRLPAGYEFVSVSGSSIDRSEESAGQLSLTVTNPAQRRHQFLVALERQTAGGSFRLDTGFVSVPAAQREVGEVAVEGTGTLEIAGIDVPGLRRIDVREADPSLASSASQALLAAYRYQRGPTGPPALALDVTRFADASVLAAVAESAVATTLVTSEGRTLTEVTLRVRNRAQPFLRVALPPGASMLSAEVEGQTAKPADGPDGTRVPLLRTGFRPTGPYTVSFVYVHAGQAFAKRGDMQMAIPKMDLPIGVVEWELFVPDRYRADRFGGNVIPSELMLEAGGAHDAGTGFALGAEGIVGERGIARFVPGSGTITGYVVDHTGAALPGATVTAVSGGQTQSAVTDASGRYTIAGLPSGRVTITGQLQGFRAARYWFEYDQRSRQLDFPLEVGGVTETIEVRAEPASRDFVSAKQVEPPANQAPSVNVQNLQRRAAGVLPVRIDVPRAGTSHRFVKPLVIDEEATVSFRYRQR